MRTNRFLTFSALILSLSTFGQPSSGFMLDEPPAEICDNKHVTFKIKEQDGFECSDLTLTEWYVRSDQTRPHWGASMHQGKEFTYTPSFGTSSRSIDLKAEITCSVYKGVDQDNYPIYENETFSHTVTIRIVHPDFFQLELVGAPSCSTSSYEFNLRDPSGNLKANNLDNITWTIPPTWSIVSGLTNSNMVVVTNGDNLGKKKIVVKYDAIASKINNSFIEKEKCVTSGEIEADFNISSCVEEIDYPPSVARHPSSHSELKTNFGLIVLPPDIYNFASSGAHEVYGGFDFIANQASSLNLFIEECGCDSKWHDPNLLGIAQVQIDNPNVIARKRTLTIEEEGPLSNGVEGMISVYPNPSSSVFNLSNLEANNQVEVVVSTMDNQRLFTQTSMVEGTGSIQLDLSLLPPGLFVLSVKSGGRTAYIKIIKK